MKKRILLSAFLLLGSVISPASVIFAETSQMTSDIHTEETTASTTEMTTATGTAHTDNITEASTTSDSLDFIPEITGSPIVNGLPYSDGIAAPKKFILSSTEKTKEQFLTEQNQENPYHSYITGKNILELSSTDFQLSNLSPNEADSIYLAIYSDNNEQSIQSLAYYLAKKMKTYGIPLIQATEVITPDASFTLDLDELFERINQYFPQASADVTVTSHEKINAYGNLTSTLGYQTIYRQENGESFSGPVLLTDKVELSDHTTWFYIQNNSRSAWISADSLTVYEPETMNISQVTGTLTNTKEIFSNLSDAWLKQESTQEEEEQENNYQVQKTIQIADQIYYELLVNNQVIGYVLQQNFHLNEKNRDTQSDSQEKTPSSSTEPGNESSVLPKTRAQAATISYATHVKNRGWLPEVADGQLSGTIGEVLRVEAFRLTLNSSMSGSVEYTTYVEGSGWQNWATNGNISGTIGQAKQIEGLNMRLTGQLATNYNLYYRVHAKNLGWLPWAMNGQKAGSLGYSYQIEAIEVRLVNKTATEPATGASYIEKSPSVLANTHVTNKGWLGQADATNQVGTTGERLSLQAMQLKLSENTIGGSITYQSHIAKKGWETAWTSNGATSGTTGQNLPIEAIKIKLTGNISNLYDIYYRVHSQEFGWLHWAKNGETAGTQGYAYRVEAIQIKLVKKGAAAPGATSRAFRLAPPKITLQGHFSDVGWINRTGLATTINYANQRKQLEAIRATLGNSSYSGSISYDSHLASIGWTNAVTNNALSGTIGQNRSMQAFSFQLNGQLAENYDIYYRAYVRSKGWLGWAFNGQKAGSVRLNLPIEAIDVRIVENDQKPSGYQANQLTILGQVDNTTSQGKFINSIAQSANRVAPTHGLYTSVMLAQAILETGYGTSTLAKNANNFFGMKFKDGEDEGKYGYIWQISNEVINGITVPVNSKFRVYQSTDSSFLDNAIKLRYGISWNPNFYKGTWKVNTKSYKDATRALTGTYATDPNYGTKLNNLIDYWKLEQFD